MKKSKKRSSGDEAMMMFLSWMIGVLMTVMVVTVGSAIKDKKEESPKYKTGECYAFKPISVEAWEKDRIHLPIRVLEVGKYKYLYKVSMGIASVADDSFKTVENFYTQKIECPKELE